MKTHQLLQPSISPSGDKPLRRSPETSLACRLLALGIAVAALPCAGSDIPGGPEYYKVHFSTNAAEAEACTTNLMRIQEALEFYRQRNGGRWPSHLSSLFPDYLDSAEVLQCPFVLKSQRWTEWRKTLREEVFRDSGSATYSYEFIEVPLEHLREAGLTNATVREYKHRQAVLLASRGGDSNNVPVVRCLCHHPVLNLPPRGTVYSSEGDWEDNFKQFASHSELEHSSIFENELRLALETGPGRKPAKPIPPRPPDLPPRLIDLTAFYNVALDETWHPGHPNNDLSQLLAAPAPLSKAQFDLRGLIQLGGAHEVVAFPNAVRGIPIQRRVKALVFLHATAWQVTNNTQVATYVVHFSDDSKREIPVRYGVDLCDWWHDPASKRLDHCEIAWRGSNAAARVQAKELRLFRTRWPNPKPEVQLQSLDLVSTMAGSAPFLVAVTAED